jgi:hypothetical protein
MARSTLTAGAKKLTVPVTVSVAMALAAGSLAAARGATGVARDDDWSYLAELLTWNLTGTNELNGWVHMMFVTQATFGNLLAKAVGENIIVLQLSTLGLGLVGLVAVFLLARWVLPAKLALVVLLLTGISPLWLHLSVTFMTDIPAWTLSAVSVCLGVAASVRQSHYVLLLGSVVALLGFGVREYAAVPFLALLLWVVWSDYPKKFRIWSFVLGIVTVAIAAVAYLWRQSLSGSVDTGASAPLESLALFSMLQLSLALSLAPYGVIGMVLMWKQRGALVDALRTYWFGTTVGIVLAVGIAFLSSFRLAGNVIHPYGSSWTSVGDGVRSLPLWGYRSVTLAAVLSLVALLMVAGMLVQRRVVARSWRVLKRPQVSGSFTSLYVFICVAVMAVYLAAIFVAGAPAFDRYLLLVVPLLGVVILWLATRSMKERLSKCQKSTVAGILVVAGAFGVVISDGLNQVDGLRWQVASDLVASGIPAYKIDGGDAWFRYHQNGAPSVAQVGFLENSIPGRTWWQTFFEGSSFCRMVAIESETDLQAMYGPALSIQEERTILGTPFRVMVFPGPDPC